MLSFRISYWDLIKFPYFVDTTEREREGIGGEIRSGPKTQKTAWFYTDNSNMSMFSPYTCNRANPVHSTCIDELLYTRYEYQKVRWLSSGKFIFWKIEKAIFLFFAEYEGMFICVPIVIIIIIIIWCQNWCLGHLTLLLFNHIYNEMFKHWNIWRGSEY
jgi:hypothetical protein